MTLSPLRILTLALAVGACTSTPETLHVDVSADCEGLLPAHCSLPWPSDRWLADDAKTATGKRLAYTAEGFPTAGRNALDFDPTAWNQLDGFSPASQLLATFGTAIDRTNLPFWTDFGVSLAADSPTVLIEAATGARVAHFTEPDALADKPEETLLYLRPAARLKERTRYIVGIRSLKKPDGSLVEAPAPFAALRDKKTTDAPSLEARRDRFEGIFTALEGAGVARASLQLAWDFTTSSGEALWGDMVRMRDDALTRVGANGLGCTITKVEEPFDIARRRIQGTFTVPSYLTAVGPKTRLNRDAEGRIAFKENIEVPFVALVPESVAASGVAAPLVTYGHGLMGSHFEATGGAVRNIAQSLQIVVGATMWGGMSEDDMESVLDALANVAKFPIVAERLMQGMVNQLVLTRTLAGVCAQKPEFQVGGTSVVDPARRYYFGISQGGIFGGTLLALSTEMTRGVLNVGAAFYPVMIERSCDFEGYVGVFVTGYGRRIDRQLILAMLQQLWDFTDPGTYLPHLIANPLPNTPAKKVLYTVGRYDSQVPNIASDMAARTAGLPLLAPAAVVPWGFEPKPAPFDGSAYVYYDPKGEAPSPLNDPPLDDNGVHEAVRRLSAHTRQMKAFLKEDGQIVHECEGPCDPE